MDVINFITYNQQNSTLDKFILILFFLFPLFFFSPFLLNASLSIISLYFFYFILKNKYFIWLNDNFVKLILIFWIYIIINSFINFNSSNEIIKSFLYVRFIILFISFVFLLPLLKVNLDNLLKVYLIISLIISIDIFFQFIFGKNILGFPCQMSCQRNSSFFQDELVAGTFVFHFGLFGLLYYFKKQVNIKGILTLSLFFLAIFLTGDRSPFLMITITIFVSFLLYDKSRKLFLKIIPIVFSLIIIFTLFSDKIYKRYVENTYNIFTTSELNKETLNWWIDFHYEQIKFISEIQTLNPLSKERKFLEKSETLRLRQFLELHKKSTNIKYKNSKISSQKLIHINKLINEELKALEKKSIVVNQVYEIRKKNNTTHRWYNNFYDSQYGAHYLTAFKIFEDNFYFGSGLKSFRKLCHQYKNINSLSASSRCSTHPHNYHLETLSEFGFVGYLFLLSLIVYLLRIYYINIKHQGFSLVIIFSMIFAKLFPFLPSGSFFSSTNSAYFWLSISIFYFLKQLKTN